jgi:hypothetical protein
MKTSASAFAHQVLIYSLVTIGFAGSAGLGAVWTEHQISLIANENKALEARIATVNRSCAETSAEIAAEEDPAVLQRRNVEWHLGLVPPAQDQMYAIAGDPVMTLAEKRNRGLFSDRGDAVSFRVAAQP